MDNILEVLYTPCLSKIGFFPVEELQSSKYGGVSYGLDPSLGKGSYWVYPVDNLYAVTIYDFVFHCDISLQCEHPAFLSLGCYEPQIANLIYNKTCHRTENLVGFTGHQNIYQQTILKNIPIRSIGLSILPEFYKTTLPTRFMEDFKDLPVLFSRLNGEESIPEVLMVLKQLRAFKPKNSLAKLYYESKVIEAISLIMQWGVNQKLNSPASLILTNELGSLEEVRAYLKQNFTGQVSLVMLTRIACMSASKLTACFKQAYGLTITEYVQIIRIEKAKEMLLNSNWSIGEIAQAVGYKKQGSLSEIFKRSTGYTPKEFRGRL